MKRRRRKTTKPSDVLDAVGTKRRLPADADELDAALRPYRIMCKPVVGGISKLATSLETAPLDDDEREGGELAISAVLYEYGAQLDSRVILAMWVAGVTLPRVAEYAQKRAAAQRKADERQQMLPLSAPTKE